MTSPGQPPVAPPPSAVARPDPGALPVVEDDGSSVLQRVSFVLACAVSGAVAAVPAAALWAQLADPPAATLTEQGLSFGELAFNQAAGVSLWFLVIGLGFGVLLGAVVGWLGRRHGVVTVIAVVVLGAVGSVLTKWCGTHLFGPENAVDLLALVNGDRNQVEAFSTGDVITGDLALATDVAYLGWPVGGLIGVLAGIASWPKPRHRPIVPPASSNLSLH